MIENNSNADFSTLQTSWCDCWSVSNSIFASHSRGSAWWRNVEQSTITFNSIIIRNGEKGERERKREKCLCARAEKNQAISRARDTTFSAFLLMTSHTRQDFPIPRCQIHIPYSPQQQQQMDCVSNFNFHENGVFIIVVRGDVRELTKMYGEQFPEKLLPSWK